ncbi:unnamed protein product, partial [Ectocarpus sp. 12 AP-2014]
MTLPCSPFQGLLTERDRRPDVFSEVCQPGVRIFASVRVADALCVAGVPEAPYLAYRGSIAGCLGFLGVPGEESGHDDVSLRDAFNLARVNLYRSRQLYLV